jgi:pimeloyl-ACP methyl ester carboxylesterase
MLRANVRESSAIWVNGAIAWGCADGTWRVQIPLKRDSVPAKCSWTAHRVFSFLPCHVRMNVTTMMHNNNRQHGEENNRAEDLRGCNARCYADGRDSAAGEDFWSCCGGGASRHQERGSGAWSIRRRLRLGSRRQDPREGWLHGVGSAAPETSYAEDQKYTKAAIDAMGGPVVLVGHSYGGSIDTEAGNDPNVGALVYIAAFALDEGESCASIEQALPQASKAFKPDSNGNWWIDQAHFAADFAADVPPAVSQFMAESQVPISTDSFTHKVTSPAWKTKPTWYMVATADRSINPDQERMMAKRANAKTIEVNASHVAYMSHPKEIRRSLRTTDREPGRRRMKTLRSGGTDIQQ